MPTGEVGEIYYLPGDGPQHLPLPWRRPVTQWATGNRSAISASSMPTAISISPTASPT